MKRTSTDPSQRRSHSPISVQTRAQESPSRPNLIDQLDRIVTPMNAMAVVNALQPDELTSHPDMPFALIRRLLDVTHQDPALQQRLAQQLLHLASNATHTQHAQDAVQQSLDTLALQLLQPAAQSNVTEIVLDEPHLPPLPEGQLIALHPAASHVPAQLRAAAPTRTLDPTVPVPDTWPKELTQSVADISATDISYERLMPPEDIRSMATAWPGRLLVRVNHELQAKYQPTLSALKWHHQLAGQEVYPEFDEDFRASDHFPGVELRVQAAVAQGVNDLVEGLEHQPPDGGIGPNNTQALLLTYPAGILSLYERLLARWGERDTKPLPRHLDLQNLPEHALFMALTMLDHNDATFDQLINDIKTSLPQFAPEVQARVMLSLWIQCRHYDPNWAETLLTLKQLPCRESGFLLDMLEAEMVTGNRPDVGDMLHALDQLTVGTALHASMLHTLNRYFGHQPMSDDVRERMVQALSDHLQWLMRMTHPHAFLPAVAIEFERLDTQMLIQVLLRWNPADQLHLLNALAGGDGQGLIQLLQRADPDDAAALRAALERLLDTPELTHRARGFIEMLLRH